MTRSPQAVHLVDSAPDVGAVLGPDSVTWHQFGDWRGMLMGLWSGSMQNMHPKLGTAVWEHSDFFGERWERLMRSLYPIFGVVFDQPHPTGREVRDYHREIKGTMPDGSRYHALDPDVFYWAHATFFYGAIRCAEVFGPPMTEAQKRHMFDESRVWYSMYGVSMRPCPETWEDFLAYWDHMCRNVLIDHPAVRTVLDISELPPPPYLRGLPRPVWRVLARPLQWGFLWLTTGLYDPPVREMMGLTWSDRDEKAFRVVGRGVHLVMSLVPRRYRLHPRARDAWDRVSGRVPADAPLVETPERNLPPESVRGRSTHYCPVHAERRADLPWQ
ncbi:oxygenase MpaB family protein [Williamsia sterculiae]|uniref:Uncharacterized conserved protein, DUF2236 family n=1 Tax=Williamsia sterculiae TaxID=1344003 RepID=A0A1N7GV41_9NOCA|nr:oxygenase MpaB family protein [Williamsia sterculiae]SIS16457.1 Uncharacterized conserved protein, DUF2236 family [Williamsia sterculiae]